MPEKKIQKQASMPDTAGIPESRCGNCSVIKVYNVAHESEG